MSDFSDKTFHPRSMAELVHLLSSYHIPIEKYGMGTRMPLKALLDQINNGTVTLQDRSGRLIRSIWLVAINVYCRRPNGMFKLHEDRQLRIDHDTKGEVKISKSRRRVTWSIAAKTTPETWEVETATKTLAKELKLHIAPRRLQNLSFRVVYRQSERFAGLKNHVRVKEWDLELSDQEFSDTGYIYDDQYLRSYFTWKRVREKTT